MAAATELSEDEIETRLQTWPGVYRDDAGRIVGFWGLSVTEMPPHEIILEGRKLSRVAPQGVISVEPREVVVSILEPTGPFDADVIATFCHYVHFFVDAQAGEKWTSEHAATFLISLEEAFELARVTNDALLRLEN